jgi:hypothetical protein
MELSGTTRQVPSFYLTILFHLSISGKLTGTLSGFIARVKPAPFGLLCAWREVPILRQHCGRTWLWCGWTRSGAAGPG